MIVSARSNIGLSRESNQDIFYYSLEPGLPLFLVGDGMGGHLAGELASNLAKEEILRYFTKENKRPGSEREAKDLVKKSIESANTKVYLKSLESSDYKGMGTTITLAYKFEDRLIIGQVGDSRAYLIRKDKIKKITEDHSYVNQLIKMGSISESEARTHPKRNVITRAVGSSSILEVDIYSQKTKDEDIILLCTDGLTTMLRDNEILEVFKEFTDLDKSCDELINRANLQGGLDNITVLAAKFH